MMHYFKRKDVDPSSIGYTSSYLDI